MTTHLLRGELAGVVVAACGEEFRSAERAGRVSGFAGRVTCRGCLEAPVPWTDSEGRLRRLRGQR